MNSVPYLLIMFLLPLGGVLMLLLAQDDEKSKGRNALSVAMLTVWASLVFIVLALSHVDSTYNHLQLVEQYVWLENPKITLTFGVDAFSLLLILSVNVAALIGMWGVRHFSVKMKSCMILTLLFLSMITGLFLAADVMSFFIFFAALLFPLFLLIGLFGDVKRQIALFRFMFYSICGALIFFVVLVVLYNHDTANVMLNKMADFKLGPKGEFFVWAAIFVALLSRIPIWPFHSWIAAVHSSIKNPLVFVLANMTPLTGIYGLMRFVPEGLPDSLLFLSTGLEVIAVITMLFIALIAFINMEFQYKIFSIMTVYYIFFMLGVFLPTSQYMLNIGFSLFAFMIIFSSIEVLVAYQEQIRHDNKLLSEGILTLLPKLSVIFTFMILAAVGMPLSAMFVNNFVLIAALLAYSFGTTVCAIAALMLVASALLVELYRRKKMPKLDFVTDDVEDISSKDFVFVSLTAVVLLLSLVNPLWFIRG